MQITLAAARVNTNLTQREVSNKIHVSERTVINWETGKTKPNLATLEMLSRIYDIPVDSFLLPS